MVHRASPWPCLPVGVPASVGLVAPDRLKPGLQRRPAHRQGHCRMHHEIGGLLRAYAACEKAMDLGASCPSLVPGGRENLSEVSSYFATSTIVDRGRTRYVGSGRKAACSSGTMSSSAGSEVS